jgi:hypothetical protein
MDLGGAAMSGLAQQRDHTLASERRRIAMLVRIAASAADFSPKLAKAVEHASDYEVRIMSDLLDRGMSVPALVHLLQGAHVIVGEDTLYERWVFPASRKRMSSHHRTVDKTATPDYGLEGPLVRESLHGKAPFGTWIQLERTKTNFRWGTLPTWSDVVHLRDYVVYRITGKNVGPWGLSAMVDTRPMVLRPTHIRVGEGANSALAGLREHRNRRRGAADQQRWSDVLTPDVPEIGPVGDLYRPEEPDDARDLLPDAPYLEEMGSGLFSSLTLVQSPAPLTPGVSAVLDEGGPSGFPEMPLDGMHTERVVVQVRGHTIAMPAIVRTSSGEPKFIGIEGDEG